LPSITTGGAEPEGNDFNRLVVVKGELENRFSLERLECFPFVENIGFTEDQRDFIRKCLRGAETLRAALEEKPDAGVRVAGIESRFLRTAGFNTILVPWDAAREEMIRFLEAIPPEPEQKTFLEKVRSVKQAILRRVMIPELYCSKRISNDDCLGGYANLLAAAEGMASGKTRWREVVVTDSFAALENPDALSLRFDAPAEEMRARLLRTTDAYQDWNERRKVYDDIQSRYGDDFRSRLRLANFFCAVNLSAEECLRGAANLHEAGADPVLRERPWGNVTIDKYNTLILDDYDAVIRHDLPAAEIVAYFSRKTDVKSNQAFNTLAEKLERRAKRNSTRLRVTCDLEKLRSVLCVRGYEAFFRFLENHPRFRANAPWTDLMLVDGSQLSRLNFALNSGVRREYIYIDAASGDEEFAAHLLNFGKIEAGDPLSREP
jgi:hypothetical protein